MQNAKTTSSITPRRSPQARGTTTGGIDRFVNQDDLEAGRKHYKKRLADVFTIGVSAKGSSHERDLSDL